MSTLTVYNSATDSTLPRTRPTLTKLSTNARDVFQDTLSTTMEFTCFAQKRKSTNKSISLKGSFLSVLLFTNCTIATPTPSLDVVTALSTLIEMRISRISMSGLEKAETQERITTALLRTVFRLIATICRITVQLVSLITYSPNTKSTVFPRLNSLSSTGTGSVRWSTMTDSLVRSVTTVILWLRKVVIIVVPNKTLLLVTST